MKIELFETFSKLAATAAGAASYTGPSDRDLLLSCLGFAPPPKKESLWLVCHTPFFGAPASKAKKTMERPRCSYPRLPDFYVGSQLLLVSPFVLPGLYDGSTTLRCFSPLPMQFLTSPKFSSTSVGVTQEEAHLYIKLFLLRILYTRTTQRVLFRWFHVPKNH